MHVPRSQSDERGSLRDKGRNYQDSRAFEFSGATGYLLNATGFDVALGGEQSSRAILLMRLCDAVIPILTSAIAIWAVAAYPITGARANEVRAELERRRGKATLQDAAAAPAG